MKKNLEEKQQIDVLSAAVAREITQEIMNYGSNTKTNFANYKFTSTRIRR